MRTVLSGVTCEERRSWRCQARNRVSKARDGNVETSECLIPSAGDSVRVDLNVVDEVDNNSVAKLESFALSRGENVQIRQ